MRPRAARRAHTAAARRQNGVAYLDDLFTERVCECRVCAVAQCAPWSLGTFALPLHAVTHAHAETRIENDKYLSNLSLTMCTTHVIT